MAGVLTIPVWCGAPGLPTDLELLNRYLPAGVRLLGYRGAAATPLAASLAVGYSRGCLHALYRACREPAVRRLVLVSPHLFSATKATVRGVLGLPLLGRFLLSRSGPRRIPVFLAASAAPDPVPPEYAALAAAYADPAVLGPALRERTPSPGQLARMLASRPGLAIVVVRGERDPHAMSADFLRSRFPGAVEEIVLAGAGHALPWTRPAAVAGCIRDACRP